MNAALAGRGRLSAAHAALLERRRSEGNQSLWAAGGDLGEPARSYLARLLRLEALLDSLPVSPGIPPLDR